jgi:hypothetical protein
MRIFLFLLLLTSVSFGQIVNSPNLLPQNFTTANGWSGSNLTSTHGTGTIAGVDGQSVQYTYSLNNLLTKSQINNGFTSTAGAELYFWNNYNQNVIITQTLVSDNNISLTQNRIVSSNGQYIPFTNYTDSFIVGSNTVNNYNITTNFAFNVTGKPIGHVAADLKNPSLYITYESNPVSLSTTTTASLQQTATDLNSVKIGSDGKVIPYKNDLTGQVYGNTLLDVYKITGGPTNSTTSTNITGTSVTGSSNSVTGSSTSITGSSTNTVEKKPAESTTTTNTTNTPVESKTETQTSASTNTEQKTETKTEESKTDSKSETKTETTSNKQENKTQVGSTNVSNKDNKQNINIQVKDINSLKIETQQTLSNMIDNRMIDVYSVPFYKSAKIYENQIQLADNKIIYPGVSLKAYLVKDLLAKRSIQLAEIKEEKKQLLIDLEVLRDAK